MRLVVGLTIGEGSLTPLSVALRIGSSKPAVTDPDASSRKVHDSPGLPKQLQDAPLLMVDCGHGLG